MSVNPATHTRRALFFFTPEFLRYDMGAWHPMRPERLQLTRDLVYSYSELAAALIETVPEPIAPEEAAETHSPQFIEELRRLEDGKPTPAALRFGLGTGDNPIFPGIYSASMLYCGASAGAAEALCHGECSVAMNISGGLHHAHYARAAGFCVLNDCAIAIRRLRRAFRRVAYVDIDVHHGDGVQELFYGDPDVLTISIHESGRTLYPGSGDVDEVGEGTGLGYSLNVPLAPWTDDEIWLMAWREAAAPVLRAFDPEAIVLQLGADAHYLDPLAHLSLTAQGWLQAVEEVALMGKPVLALGGGGYNLTTVPRMWTLAAAQLVGVPLPNETPYAFGGRASIPTLLDAARPTISARDARAAFAAAERVIASIQQDIFPMHGLRPAGTHAFL